jgi:hypothetical protein
MVIGAAMVSADWVVLTSVWEASTSPCPHWDGCSDVEESEEMDVADGATARVASTGGLKVVFLQSVPLRM